MTWLTPPEDPGAKGFFAVDVNSSDAVETSVREMRLVPNILVLGTAWVTRLPVPPTIPATRLAMGDRVARRRRSRTTSKSTPPRMRPKRYLR